MAVKTKPKGKGKPAAKPAAKKAPVARKVETASDITLGVDDKRAQYARLVVFNYGVSQKLIGKDKDVNSVSKGDLSKAFKSLVGGNLLDGKGGIEFIQSMSSKGATDAKVAERGLTTAYAQEVRPFIRRGQLSDAFGRRGKKAEPKAAKGEAAPAEETPAE